MLLSLIVLLTGCVTTDYYKRSDSPGYNETHWGGLCEKCNRMFTFSTAQYDQEQYITCPYCGYEQDLRMASKRYNYEMQQQAAYSMRQSVNNYRNSQKNYWKERVEKSRQRIQNIFNESMRGTPQYYERQKIEEMRGIRRSLENLQR